MLKLNDGWLLFAELEILVVLKPLQIVTGMYLAGVLLPCPPYTPSPTLRTVGAVCSGVDGAAGDRGDRVFPSTGLGRQLASQVSNTLAS